MTKIKLFEFKMDAFFLLNNTWHLKTATYIDSKKDYFQRSFRNGYFATEICCKKNKGRMKKHSAQYPKIKT